MIATVPTGVNPGFLSSVAARAWRQDAMVALRRGTFQPGRAITIRQAGAEWIEAAKAGLVRNRSGDPYKPSALRAYEDALRLCLLMRQERDQRCEREPLSGGLGSSSRSAPRWASTSPARRSTE
jgi:hypothetical protein